MKPQYRIIKKTLCMVDSHVYSWSGTTETPMPDDTRCDCRETVAHWEGNTLVMTWGDDGTVVR